MKEIKTNKIIKISEKSLNEENNKKEYPFVDYIKFICAVAVFVTHCKIFDGNTTFGFYANFITRKYINMIAVPFFFVCSGFFLYRKIDENNVNRTLIFKYISKIIFAYIAWILIYEIVYPLLTNQTININFIKLIQNTINGYSHLWYLNALVVSVLIIYILNKKISLNKVTIISFILFAIGILGNEFYYVIKPIVSNTILSNIFNAYFDIFNTTRNGLFYGLFFVSLGALFSKKRIYINLNVAIISFIICAILMYFEAEFVVFNNFRMSDDFYIMLIPCSFLLFYISSHICISSNKKSKIARNMSTIIYITHKMIINIFEILFYDIYIGNISLVFILSLVTTVFVSYSVQLIANKYNIKYLKKLFMI